MLGYCFLQYIITIPTFVVDVIAKSWPRSVVSRSMLMSNSIVITGSQPTSDDSVSELRLCSLNSNYLASLDILQLFFIFKLLFVSIDDCTVLGFRACICPFLSLPLSTSIIVAIVLMLQKFTYHQKRLSQRLGFTNGSQQDAQNHQVQYFASVATLVYF